MPDVRKSRAASANACAMLMSVCAWLISVLRYNTRTPNSREFNFGSRSRVNTGNLHSCRFVGLHERREMQMKAEFHIEGMHCESCAVDIKETLETTAGVRHADLTFNGKTANIEFDENVVQEKTLIKKIQDLGYNATVADES